MNNRNLVYSGYLFAGLAVFYPSLTGYYYADDFAFLTIARFIGNPLAFFYHSHFPGSFFYRPVGLLSWWFSYQLAGTQQVYQNLINILIHIGNACVLFRIFTLVRDNMKLNALLALLFLVHPLTISTTMWLSDRFDLLSTLFFLFSICLYLRYRVDGSRQAYVLSVAACILAVLSKEIAYFIPVVITVAAFKFRRNAAPTMREKLYEIIPFYAVVLLAFGLRFALLRTAVANQLLGENSLLTVMVGGIGKWLRLSPDYYLFYSDFAHWNMGVYALMGISLAVLSGYSLNSLFRQGKVEWGMVALGLTIMLTPAVLQAPVSFSRLFHNISNGFEVVNMVNSRFYYLSFAGFLLAAQQPLSVVCNEYPRRRIASSLIYILLALVSLFFGILSHSLGSGWSQLSNGQSRHVAEQASLAVDQLPLPQNSCKVYLLNTPPDALYFREYSDSAIKALASEGSQAIHCLVMTEKAPWYQFLLREDVASMQIAPLRHHMVGGKVKAPTLIGNLAYVYLNVPDDSAVARDPNAVFLEFDGNKFNDVTQQVHSGLKKIRFYSDRP